MERNRSPSKPLKLLKNERWRPYIRWEKETDTWITKAIKEKQSVNGEMETIMDKVSSKIKILMDRKQLDIIAKLVAYMYHDKKDEYEEIASELRKEHIYKDLKSINQWLDIQYNRIDRQEERDKNINALDQEIINELSK